MSNFTTSLFYILLLSFCCPHFTKAQVNSTDSLALVALYNATDGPNWLNTWNLSQPVSAWYGVALSNGRVTCLDLDGNYYDCYWDIFGSGNNLSGHIPAQIGELSELKQLSLYKNNLTGSIPPELGNLNKLEILDLHNNQLIGNIPSELGSLDNLIRLYLYDNQLSNNIPPELGNLNNLEFLLIQDNQITGSIPTTLGNLNNLGSLNLSNNQLSGCYDSNLLTWCIQLNNLLNTHISDGNNFMIPWEAFCGGSECILQPSDSLALVALHNATDGPNWLNTWNLNQPVNTWHGVTIAGGRVVSIELAANQLTGTIPVELGDLNNLTELILLFNNLTGNIPAELGDLTNLTNLALEFNQLTGNIPPELGNLNNLTNLSLFLNQLTGNIPTELGNLNNLTRLALEFNQLTGSIPPELGNLSNLIQLFLSNNSLTGDIPSQLGNLTNLADLDLSNNQLSACYDSNLLTWCSQLNSPFNTHISDGNNFTISWEAFCGGDVCIPDIEPSDSLALIALYNATNGSNWTNTWNLNQPVITWYGVTLLDGRVVGIDLAGNNLTGNIPPELGNLSNLTELILPVNQLFGSIPPELGSLNNLIALWLGGNNLTGNIPPELENLNNLVSLVLSSNQLSGSIPPELGNLNNLNNLSISSNQLSGSIPPELGSLNNLVLLDLFHNQLTGSIPSELGNLSNLTNLDLEFNQLSGTVPDFSNLPNLFILDINKNKFSQEDILVNYAANNLINGFIYYTQYHGEVQSYIVESDTTLTLELSTPLSGNNNQNVSYQWKKNDLELTGNTDSIFMITNLQISDVGKYTLHMTDSTRIADLEVISKPIYVILPGYDLYGQPVVYNQIMVEFDNESTKQSYENEHLYPNAGIIQDSCSCNRDLYLWQFPTDTLALQVLLDVNTKVETQDGKADVDGGPNNIFNLGVSNNNGTAWSWTGDYTGVSYQDSVKVFILDSGLDEGNWDASPYLLPNAPADSCYALAAAAGYDYTDSLAIFTTNYMDSLGHGTFGFRSIVNGLNDYMDIKSVPLKVFDQDGEATLFKFVCALYHAIDHDADVVNISAGYRGQPSEILAKAVQLAQQKEIFIVTAAGNDGVNIDSIPQFPAYFSGTTYEYETGFGTIDIPYNNVISVASINAQDSLSVFSNYGINNATLAAYGENMSGYGIGGVNVISSGTSISTFYVTRELSAEIAKNKTRSLQDIWSDFEMNRLADTPAIHGLTKTGKRLDIQIINTCLSALMPGGDIANGIYQAGQIINSNGIIPMGSHVQFKAGEVIILESGFQVHPQSGFSGEIEDCEGNE